MPSLPILLIGEIFPLMGIVESSFPHRHSRFFLHRLSSTGRLPGSAGLFGRRPRERGPASLALALFEVYPRQELNLKPSAPQAGALSN